jgi:hypothetical protein
MYSLPTILPWSGRYSGQRVHKFLQISITIRYISPRFNNRWPATRQQLSDERAICIMWRIILSFPSDHKGNKKHSCSTVTDHAEGLVSIWCFLNLHMLWGRAFWTRQFRRTRTQTEVQNSDSDSGLDLRNCDFPTPWPKIISQWNTYDVLTIVDICACGLLRE